MFENTRKVLDEFENTYTKIQDSSEWSKDEEDKLIYFNMHLAKALMQDEFVGDETVAKIILATKNLSNEIKVRVQ